MQDAHHRTATYRIVPGEGGDRYHFFCDLSGALCHTTGPIAAETQEAELRLAWEEGRSEFNQCRQCGRWICDTMYNADVLACVDCAPWEETPHFCPQCGEEAIELDTYCRKCGARLRYGEVWT